MYPKNVEKITNATAVVILVPPDAPRTSRTWSPPNTIVGHMDDKDILPGANLFAGDQPKPKKFWNCGNEKSSMPLFKMIPVCFDANPAPKL